MHNKFSKEGDNLSELNVSKHRLVSIGATISHASRNSETIYNMLRRGVNIFRLNCSHETHEAHLQTIELVNNSIAQLEKETGQTMNVAFAIDIRGPQIRTGLLEGGNEIVLRRGENVRLSINMDLYDKGGKEVIFIDYPNIINVARPQDRIFIDDGKLLFGIIEVGVDCLLCEVIQGGTLGNNCNVILPEVETDLPTVSERDMEDLQFGVGVNIDILLAAGIRSAKNIKELRSILGDKGKYIKIIAKLDSKICLSRLGEIINASDGLMVCRADLGTQIPFHKIVFAQKMVIENCNQAGKPVIIASNVLESMRFKQFPTRSECFDLANAVIDGADVILLSSEVAIGLYPILTVDICDTLCCEAEKVILSNQKLCNNVGKNLYDLHVSQSIAIMTVETASRVNASLIIVLTTSGRSAALISKFKPQCPILAVTRCIRAARWGNLYRGIIPIHYSTDCSENFAVDIDARVKFALTSAKKWNLIKEGDSIVIASAWKNGGGLTNNVRVIYSFFESDSLDCLFHTDRLGSQKYMAANNVNKNMGSKI